jgi:hypothetical protein
MPGQKVTRRELLTTLARLVRSLPNPPDWPLPAEKPMFSDVSDTDPDRALIEAVFLCGKLAPQTTALEGNQGVSWEALNSWLKALGLPTFASLEGRARQYALTRSECVDYLYRVLQLRGEADPENDTWLQPKWKKP